AVARNPNIKLYGLPWAAPGWIDSGGNYWVQNSIDYLIQWLDCAKSHGLTVAYLGGRNEKGHNKTWSENLRSALNSPGYIDGKMTAYLNWPLIAAITPNLPFATVGLAVAPSPWSGAYRLGKETWATAQVTQFTAPGWKFLDSASGYLGGDRVNGSYVSLKSTNGKDYSTIIETTTATATQSVNVSVSGGLSTGTAPVG